MKAGGFDPLFSLHHTCAMSRDNTKRLSRRTWCTTKLVPRLQCLLAIYTVFLNEWLLEKRGFERELRVPEGLDAEFAHGRQSEERRVRAETEGGLGAGAAM
jgi:hypothetical protein